MKFDELFNKVMERFEIVNEDIGVDTDPYDSTGESSGEEIINVDDTPTDLTLTAGFGGGEIESNEDRSKIEKELAEIEKAEQTSNIDMLNNSITQSKNNINRYTKMRNKSKNLEVQNICQNFLNKEVPRLAQLEKRLEEIKQTMKSKVSTSTQPAESEEKEPDKKEEKEPDKKEEKEPDKKEEKKESEKKEDKKEEKKNESVEQTDAVLVESKKPTGTEFYLTELN